MLGNLIPQRFARVSTLWSATLRTLICGIALLGAGILLLTACDSSLTQPKERSSKHRTLQSELAGSHFSAEVNRQLAAARRATAPFHNLDKATKTEYEPITGCVEHPSLGAQGTHYGNLSLMGDDEVKAGQPEVLMYEPRKNGKLRLVGIEYIIPFTELGADSDPPELFGQHFHANEELGLWALHVWIWRHNPSGLFADWNPNVTCAFAAQ